TEAKSDEVATQKEDTSDAKHTQKYNTTTTVKANNTSYNDKTQSKCTTLSNHSADNNNNIDEENDNPTTDAKNNDPANDETVAKSDEVATQKKYTSDTKHIQAVNNKTTNVADSKFSNDKVETKSDKVSTPSPSVSTDIEENDSTNSDNNTSQEIAHVYSNASAPKLRMERSVR